MLVLNDYLFLKNYINFTIQCRSLDMITLSRPCPPHSTFNINPPLILLQALSIISQTDPASLLLCLTTTCTRDYTLTLLVTGNSTVSTSYSLVDETHDHATTMSAEGGVKELSRFEGMRTRFLYECEIPKIKVKILAHMQVQVHTLYMYI